MAGVLCNATALLALPAKAQRGNLCLLLIVFLNAQPRMYCGI